MSQAFSPSRHLHRLTADAMLAALFFALSLFSVDLGFIKFTVAPLAILIAALLFGPTDGMAVGLIGAFLEQWIKYGFSITMPLWILPAVARGLVAGLLALLLRRALRKCGKHRITKLNESTVYFTVGVVLIAMLSALVVTALNTIPLYVDFKVYGWSDENPLLWTYLSARFVSGIITSAILGLVTPFLLIPLAKLFERVRKPCIWTQP